jgi:CRISPR/Cas system-associated exonuclease Cas4 (RecB family)
MVKTLSTLVDDIYGLFTKSHEFNQTNVEEFGKRLATHISNRVNDEKTGDRLRMSSLGTRCDRKLWYQSNAPESAEPLSGETRFKFLYGDILEELVLFLAKEAGHSVEGTQDTLTISGVKGHRDAVVDGVVVDVKSASSYSFKKFEDGLTDENDAFGYLDQLGAYLYASQKDEKVVHKDRAAFIAVDKTLGHITVDVQPNTGKNYDKVVAEKKAVVSAKEPPARHYSDEPDGKSGNRKLGTACSYCNFKQTCWPSLQTYIYSSGPRYLTKVVREPDVPKAS